MEPAEPVGSNPASGRAYLPTGPQRLIQAGLVALGWVVPWARRVPQAPARPNATNRIDRAPGGAVGVSFCLALLGPTGAHCLDGPTNLTCKENTR